ncbi:MAG: SRPBCC domain-containing protein [Dehalococcoidia bacterium]
MAQATTTQTAIERELHIEASPAIVFSYLTDPAKMTLWMGREVRANATPGGALEIDYNLMDRMRGEYLEVVPNSRVVFSWGWSSLGDQTPPGASRVEVTLTPDGNGTLLRLVHSGLEGAEAESHSQGWDLFLGYLVESAQTGKATQPPAEALNPSEAYARRLNALLCDLRYAIEGLTDQQWAKQCAGTGWSVGVTANHAVSHIGLVDFAMTVAGGERSPLADFSLEDLNASNARNSAESAGVTREKVLTELRTHGPGAVEAIKNLDPAKLGAAQRMAFAGGVEVPVSGIIEGPLLSDLEGHLADIRAGIAG